MLDLWIVGIFLLITLVVGIWQSRGVKDFKSFSIADRNYSTGVLVATISATLIGGESSLAVAEKTFIVGFFFFFVMLGDVVDNLLLAKFVTPHLAKFRECISIGDIASKLYGRNAKIIVGITGVISLIAVVGAQIAAMGHIFHYFLDITPLAGIIIGAGIIIIYSFFGGVRAVTITDVIQFIVLIVAIPMICNIGIMKIGGYDKLLDSLPISHLSIFPPEGEFQKYFYLFVISAIPGLNASLVQRLLMAKDGNQARKSLICSALIYIPFYKMVCVIGLLALVMNPTLNPVYAMPDLINNILPAGLKGIAICGILAIAMSTADSIINVWSILMVHDVISPLYKEELSDKNQLKLARFFTIIIGVWGSFIALKFRSIFDIILLGRFFWKPIVIVGLLAGMSGFRASKQSFYLGMIAGVSILIIRQDFNNETILLAIFLNVIVFFGSHYYYKRYRPEILEQIPSLIPINEPIGGKKKSWLSNLRLQTISSYAISFSKYFTLRNLAKLSNIQVMEWGAPYQLFAVFAILNYIIPFFMWSNEESSFWELSVMRLIAGILCVGLLIISDSKGKMKEYVALYWYSTIVFCLPYMTSLMYFANPGSTYWTVSISLSIFLFSILVNWRSFCLLFPLGTILGYCSFIRIFKESAIKISNEQGLLILYIFGFSLIIAILFSRRREGFVEEKLEALLQAMGGSIAHELRTPLSSINLHSQIIDASSDQLLKVTNSVEENHAPLYTIKESSQLIQDTISSTSLIIDMLLTNMKDPAQESHKANYSIKQLIEDAIDHYPLDDNQRKLIRLNLEDDFECFGNELMLSHVIYNLLKNSLYYIKQANKGEIFISIKRSEDYNRLSFKDTGKGIPTEMLPHMFKRFYSKSNKGTGLGLAFCKLVMEDLGGRISCNSVYGEYIEFILEFPIIERNVNHQSLQKL